MADESANERIPEAAAAVIRVALDHCASVTVAVGFAMKAVIGFAEAVAEGVAIDRAQVATWAETAKDLQAVLEQLEDLTATLRRDLR